MTLRASRAPCAVVALLALAGCSGGGGGGTGGGGNGGGGGGGGNASYELYDAGFFSVQKPKGWDVVTAGACDTFAFLLADPQDPLRQVFYFSTIGPVYLTQAQKDFDASYVAHGGYDLITWADAPVIDPLTPVNFMEHWPQIAAMKAATRFMSRFPPLEGLKLAASADRANVLSGATTAESRGLFKLAGRVGEGMFLVAVRQFSPCLGGPGGCNAYGHFVSGITAPKEEFSAKMELLAGSLNSFTVTQAYVNSCLQASLRQWTAVAAAGKTLSEASDILWDGWVARTHAEDITAEKYSDGFRGVDRVYDPGTGTVYEVPVGWYETYDASRAQYTMGGLQPLPEQAYDLWMKATTSGSQIH